jgi:hypothetical protein
MPSILKLKSITKATKTLLLEKLLKCINKENNIKTAKALIGTWLNTGIISIDNIIEWWKDYQLLAIFEEEFNMYKYYLNVDSNYYQPRWLYNCYYLLY